MLQPEDFLAVMNRALDGMCQSVEQLGDECVNQRPDFPDANSPYAILAHCVGLTHYWVGRIRNIHSHVSLGAFSGSMWPGKNRSEQEKRTTDSITEETSRGPSCPSGRKFTGCTMYSA